MRILKISLLVVLGLLVLGTLVFLLGPQPGTPQYNPTLPQLSPNPVEIEEYVAAQSMIHMDIKPGCEERIVWHDPAEKAPTPWSLVYIHGFSACAVEGLPIAEEFAQRYGMNLYLARMADHGIDTAEVMHDLTADRMLRTAQLALSVGRALGDSVLLMSTSTGGTLSLYLASVHNEVKGLINYSPNVHPADPKAELLTMPWGLHIARMVLGGKYRSYEADPPETEAYWTTTYRIEGVIAMQALVEFAMQPATFARITQPSLTAFYYKDSLNKDEVVSIPAIRQMHAQLGTPDSLKRMVELETPGGHVIASGMKSKGLPEVRRVTWAFAEEVLGLEPLATDSLAADGQ